MSLINKVVVVTGASAGIGAATAVIMAREGANVVIVGRNETNLNNVANQCGKVGKKAMTVKGDVCNDADAAAIIKKTMEKYGKLDVLVNNAGILRACSVFDKKYVSVFDEVINTNLRSVVVLTNLAAPYLVETKGNIINISSVAGIMTNKTNAAYCTSKAALNHYSRVIASELGEKGVRVNIISPGPVDTGIFDFVGGKAADYDSKTLLNKVSKPEEIGELIAYVASEKASSIAGANYVIDCGIVVKSP